MKFTSTLLILLLSIAGADAQVKKERSLFGFGKKSEQISAGLFPDNNAPSQPIQASAPATSQAPTAERAPAPPRTSDNIFKSGAPQTVESVSYTIENGQKVEQDAKPKRKARRFGFGKKEKETEVAEVDALDPVPAPAYPDPQNTVTEAPTFTPAPIVEQTPEPPAPRIKRTPKPVAPEVQSVEETIPADVIAAAPVEETTQKDKSGFLSFFSRKKNKDASPVIDEPVAAPSNDAPVPEFTAPTVAENSPPAPAQPAPAPASNPPAVAPQPSFPTQPDNADPIPTVPTFAGVPEASKPRKEKNGFRLGDPISKLRPSKQSKPVDLTGAETIISNGEIVDDASENIVEDNIVSSGDGTREAPRMVNGVKTYSSWEDVEARSVSAADKILNQIR